MKKSLFAVLAVLLFFALPASAQIPLPTGAEQGHLQAGVYYAQAYGTWKANVLTGNVGTGAGNSIVVTAPTALSDGYVPPISSIFNSVALAPVTIVDGNAETFTPTAIVIGACPTGVAGPIGSQCATITGTIANLHGPSATVQTGDSGLLEAQTDASANGGGPVYWQVDCGNITMNTGGVTTTTTCLVPKTTYVGGASIRVITTITTTATYGMGIASATTSWIAACSSLTAGLTCSQFVAAPTSVAQGAGLGAVLITANAASGAGVIHPRLWGYIQAQSAF